MPLFVFARDALFSQELAGIGFMTSALVQKAAALGANNVLAKPFTIEKMKAAIEAVFGALK